MKKILLDANFLLLPFESKLDLFGEIERIVGEPHSFFTTKSVKLELERFADLKNKKAVAAGCALSYLLPKIALIEDAGYADDSLFALAKKEKFIVCTNDAGLRSRLRAEKIPTIIMRNHKLALL
ncbi:Ribonuclease VapC9 [Candidatus Anstonella stagnisolia]|nr:Ribonuclease VapC9 [Candidatus Anstonella stagnisolia]